MIGKGSLTRSRLLKVLFTGVARTLSGIVQSLGQQSKNNNRLVVIIIPTLHVYSTAFHCAQAEINVDEFMSAIGVPKEHSFYSVAGLYRALP